MIKALFITTEDGDDLIVSFAIPVPDPSDVRSLTLLRTPKYEFILDDAERGVHVYDDGFAEVVDNYLQEIEVGKDVVRLVTRYHCYTVDVKDVDDAEIKRMRRILKMMNFDDRFILKMRE